MSAADELYIAQRTLARGQTFLYKIEKERIEGPKGGVSYRSKPPKQVTDPEEVLRYLEREVDKANGDIEDEFDRSATYYYITTKEPSNQALDSLLDRTFGKAVQAVELSGKDGVALFGDEERAKSKKAIGEYIGADSRQGGPKGD